MGMKLLGVFIMKTKSLLVLGITVLVSAGINFAQEATTQDFVYSQNSQLTVVKMDSVGMVSKEEGAPPFLQIFGDGRVQIHESRERSFRAKGTYEMYLSENEMQELLTSLYNIGLMEFDVQETKRKKTTAIRDRNKDSKDGEVSFRVVFDAATIVIDLYLDSYRPPGSTDRPIRNFRKHIAWQGVHHDAQEYPEVPELTTLLQIQSALGTYSQSRDLVRISNE